LVASLPAYGLAYLIGSATSGGVFAILIAIVSFVFGMIVMIISLDFLLDKLIITNRRVILEDWKNIFMRVQDEAKFEDIQDVETRENGVFARFKSLDFGSLKIETSASETSISYKNCPDPEGVKHKIFEQVAFHNQKRQKEH